VQYLSDEWMQAADEALRADAELSEAARGAEVTVQYDVSGAPGGARKYALTVADGAVGIDPGPHPDAPVSFSLDYDTAAEIARGELAAQVAFMQGRLKLGGDVTVLVRQHALFDRMVDALGDLRGSTEF